MSSAKLDASLSRVFDGNPPPEVEALGAPERDFTGSLVGEGVLRLIGSILSGLVGLALAAGFVAIGLDKSWTDPCTGIVGLGSIICLGVSVWLFQRARRYFGTANNALILCEKGFVLRMNGKRAIFRWDGITAVEFELREVQLYNQYGNVTAKNCSASYRIASRDVDVRLSDAEGFQHLGRFMDIVREETYPYLLASAVQVFNAGRTIRFGGVSLDRKGIRYEEKELEWGYVDEPEIEGGRLCLYDNRNRAIIGPGGGRDAWADPKTSKVAHLPVVIDLIYHIHQHGTGPILVKSVARQELAGERRVERHMG